MKLSRKTNQRGIGLLELTLSLAIIAMLLVVATRYFVSANEQQKINNALSEIHGIVGGAANYAVSNSNTGGGYTGISIQALVTGNFVPPNFAGNDGNGGGANPWLGGIAVEAASAGLKVTMTGVPEKSCERISNSINNNATAGTATCNGGTVTANFK